MKAVFCRLIDRIVIREFLKHIALSWGVGQTSVGQGVSMLEVRQARVGDAVAIAALAHEVSYERYRSLNYTEAELSRKGFLLYPLTAQSDTEANYAERIEKSSHFWVAMYGDEAAAFLMAYTFDVLESLELKTDNDRGVIDFFRKENDYVPNCIYASQAAIAPKHRRHRPFRGLVEDMSQKAPACPAMIAEIAQRPHKNVASSAFAKRSAKMKLVFHRHKDNGARVSGTFIRVF